MNNRAKIELTKLLLEDYITLHQNISFCDYAIKESTDIDIINIAKSNNMKISSQYNYIKNIVFSLANENASISNLLKELTYTNTTTLPTTNVVEYLDNIQRLNELIKVRITLLQDFRVIKI